MKGAYDVCSNRTYSTTIGDIEITGSRRTICYCWRNLNIIGQNIIRGQNIDTKKQNYCGYYIYFTMTKRVNSPQLWRKCLGKYSLNFDPPSFNTEYSLTYL